MVAASEAELGPENYTANNVAAGINIDLAHLALQAIPAAPSRCYKYEAKTPFAAPSLILRFVNHHRGGYSRFIACGLAYMMVSTRSSASIFLNVFCPGRLRCHGLYSKVIAVYPMMLGIRKKLIQNLLAVCLAHHMKCRAGAGRLTYLAI